MVFFNVTDIHELLLLFGGGTFLNPIQGDFSLMLGDNYYNAQGFLSTLEIGC